VSKGALTAFKLLLPMAMPDTNRTSWRQRLLNTKPPCTPYLGAALCATRAV